MIRGNRFLIVLALLFFASPLMAADYCVTPSGAGGKTGADWSNALSWADTAGNAFGRGDTYYIAGCTAGTCGALYAAKRLYTATSGESLITIKKATAGSHVTDTGWQASYGTDQAVFGEQINFTTAYWTWDGVVGSGDDPDSYGFKIQYTGDCSTDDTVHRLVGMPGVGYSSAVLSNVTFSHTAMPNCGMIGSGTSGQMGIYSNPVDTQATAMTISDNLFSDGGGANLVIRNWASSTITDNYFNRNWSSATNHGQQISPGSNCDDITLKNNIFKDSQVFVVGSHPDGVTTEDRWLIFNNLVIGGTATPWANANSGTADGLKSWQIHNNTYVGVDMGAKGSVFIGTLTDAATDKSYASNELFYDCVSPRMDNPGFTAGAISHDYNAYLKCTGTINSADETAPQRDDSATDPFTDSAGGDYTLKSGTLPIDHGTTLAATYETDKAGVTRPQGAAWDMGAYEYEAPAGSWIVTFTTTSPCTAPAAIAVANAATGSGTLTVPNGYKHGTTSSGTWSGNTVTTAAILADTTVTLGCETIKIGGVK